MPHSDLESVKVESSRRSFLLAASAGTGAMLTPDEAAEYEKLASSEVTQREQELVCWIHVEAVNKGTVL